MVHILTDTTSCLSPEAGQQFGITVVPQLVEFSGVRYREWVDLPPAAFIEKLKNSPEPPVSTPSSVEVFAEALRPLAEAGEGVICIGPSSKLSQTLAIMEQAAGRFPGADIRLVDTRQIGSANATLAMLAAQWAAEGQNIDRIETHLFQMLPNARVYFLVPTLDYLQRGGRIGGASAMVGRLLQLKPILTFTDGQVDQYDMVRTFRHALVRLQDLVVANARTDWELHLSVMHAGDEAQGKALAQGLAWMLSLPRVPLYDVPPTITCHSGPGTLGVSFFVNDML